MFLSEKLVRQVANTKQIDSYTTNARPTNTDPILTSTTFSLSPTIIGTNNVPDERTPNLPLNIRTPLLQIILSH